MALRCQIISTIDNRIGLKTAIVEDLKVDVEAAGAGERGFASVPPLVSADYLSTWFASNPMRSAKCQGKVCTKSYRECARPACT